MEHVIARAPEREGDARAEEALLLVHGFLGSEESWDAVRRECRRPVQAITLPGHGRESPPSGSFDDALWPLLGALSARPRAGTLVGYSLGARIALGLAAHASRPFSRLVLVSGRDGLADPHAARARARDDDALADALEREGLELFVDRWQASPLFETQRALPDAVRAAHRARRLAHDPRRLGAALRVFSLGRMPRYAALVAERTPRVDLVAGERDAKFVTLAHELARELGARTRATVHVVAGAGHDVVLEQPGALAAILEERA